MKWSRRALSPLRAVIAGALGVVLLFAGAAVAGDPAGKPGKTGVV